MVEAFAPLSSRGDECGDRAEVANNANNNVMNPRARPTLASLSPALSRDSCLDVSVMGR
jgi:hypothetical protein